MVLFRSIGSEFISNTWGQRQLNKRGARVKTFHLFFVDTKRSVQYLGQSKNSERYA